MGVSYLKKQRNKSEVEKEVFKEMAVRCCQLRSVDQVSGKRGGSVGLG